MTLPLGVWTRTPWQTPYNIDFLFPFMSLSFSVSVCLRHSLNVYLRLSLSHSLIPPTLCVCMSVPVVFLWPASSVINDGKVLLHSNTISLYCRHISPTSNFLICVFVLFGKHSVSPMIKSYPNKSNQM